MLGRAEAAPNGEKAVAEAAFKKSRRPTGDVILRIISFDSPGRFRLRCSGCCPPSKSTAGVAGEDISVIEGPNRIDNTVLMSLEQLNAACSLCIPTAHG